MLQTWLQPLLTWLGIGFIDFILIAIFIVVFLKD